MLPARDIYTAAQILTKCFGDDAKLKAVKFAYKLLNEGNIDCVAVRPRCHAGMIPKQVWYTERK
jgi:hypothetical protein